MIGDGTAALDPPPTKGKGSSAKCACFFRVTAPQSPSRYFSASGTARSSLYNHPQGASPQRFRPRLLAFARNPARQRVLLASSRSAEWAGTAPCARTLPRSTRARASTLDRRSAFPQPLPCRDRWTQQRQPRGISRRGRTLGEGAISGRNPHRRRHRAGGALQMMTVLDEHTKSLHCLNVLGSNLLSILGL